MATAIVIMGPVGGCSTLERAIKSLSPSPAYLVSKHSGEFGKVMIYYRLKEEAKIALWKAYCNLREDKEDAKKSNLSYKVTGRRRRLGYDASEAVILENAKL